jgi:hypothetical protein
MPSYQNGQRVPAGMHTYIHVCTFIYMLACIHVCIYTYTCIHTHTHIYIYIYIYIYIMNIYIYIYIHILFRVKLHTCRCEHVCLFVCACRLDEYMPLLLHEYMPLLLDEYMPLLLDKYMPLYMHPHLGRVTDCVFAHIHIYIHTCRHCSSANQERSAHRHRDHARDIQWCLTSVLSRQAPANFDRAYPSCSIHYIGWSFCTTGTGLYESGIWCVMMGCVCVCVCVRPCICIYV